MKELPLYRRLIKLSLGWLHYAFFDAEDCTAESLFRRHQVRVQVRRVSASSQEGYRMVLCRVPRREKAAAEAALNELPRKMLLFGHTDYEAFCREIWDGVREEKEEPHGENGAAEQAQ